MFSCNLPVLWFSSPYMRIRKWERETRLFGMFCRNLLALWFCSLPICEWENEKQQYLESFVVIFLRYDSVLSSIMRRWETTVYESSIWFYLQYENEKQKFMRVLFSFISNTIKKGNKSIWIVLFVIFVCYEQRLEAMVTGDASLFQHESCIYFFRVGVSIYDTMWKQTPSFCRLYFSVLLILPFWTWFSWIARLLKLLQ